MRARRAAKSGSDPASLAGGWSSASSLNGSSLLSSGVAREATWPHTSRQTTCVKWSLYHVTSMRRFKYDERIRFSPHSR
eukprot:5421005-Pyramimonas_sp.AAC.1